MQWDTDGPPACVLCKQKGHTANYLDARAPKDPPSQKPSAYRRAVSATFSYAERRLDRVTPGPRKTLQHPLTSQLMSIITIDTSELAILAKIRSAANPTEKLLCLVEHASLTSRRTAPPQPRPSNPTPISRWRSNITPKKSPLSGQLPLARLRALAPPPPIPTPESDDSDHSDFTTVRRRKASRPKTATSYLTEAGDGSTYYRITPSSKKPKKANPTAKPTVPGKSPFDFRRWRKPFPGYGPRLHSTRRMKSSPPPRQNPNDHRPFSSTIRDAGPKSKNNAIPKALLS
ncbi:hypothetical protein EVAR_46320_1 [Eumeta japonica]|uniref:Uncharacterized protein n=1 Tax=Eumeta variegata TaxID=151549 RepID=A0A4C1WY81_EUMVA|nr:hypothetical protein EVAR_46320_1 [Eumeta japonica]